MAIEKRLGRGLGSLLGSPRVSEPPAALEPVQTTAEATPLEVGVDRIEPNPFQPRRTFDPVGLEELRDSILEHGILQPLVLREVGDGYQLVAGERRLRAARLAGLERVPVVLRSELDDAQMLELALVENVQRRDLDAIERALGYQGLVERLGMTQGQVAKRVGLQRSTIANHLRLLELPEEAQSAVAQGLISMGHARALLAVSEPEALLVLLARTCRDGLSVRRVEELARAGTPASPAQAGSASSGGQSRDLPPWARELEDRMREHLGTRVRLRLSGVEKGQVVIDFFGRESLDRLCDVLAPRAQL